MDTDPWRLDAQVVARSQGTDPARGLTAGEAAARLARVGRNQLAAAAPVPRWRKLLAQFRDPLVYLLLVAVAVSLVAWIFEGRQGAPVDSLVIVVIVIANAVLGYVQEAKAEQAVAALQRMAASTASVVRDGNVSRIPADELVPGDLLVLAEGDAVGADGRLVQAATLRVAEASLTGESEPVLKQSAKLAEPAALGDRLNMVYKGTAVSQGVGRAVVTATGMRTEMGQIAGLLARTVEEPTPLQREIARLGRLLGLAVVAIAAVVVAAVLITSDSLSAGRPGRRVAAGGVDRRGGRARGVAGDPVGGAGARRAADGCPAGDREEAVVGRDAGVDRRSSARTRRAR